MACANIMILLVRCHKSWQDGAKKSCVPIEAALSSAAMLSVVLLTEMILLKIFQQSGCAAGKNQTLCKVI